MDGLGAPGNDLNIHPKFMGYLLCWGLGKHFTVSSAVDTDMDG